jgi:beta-glucanase (GH16 family)
MPSTSTRTRRAWSIAGVSGVVAAAVLAVTPLSAHAALPGIEDFESPLRSGNAAGVPVGWFVATDPNSAAAYDRTTTPPTPVPGSADGNTVLRVDATVSSWAVVIHAFENATADAWTTQDWSPYAGLQFWFEGTGSGTSMFIDVMDNRNPDSTVDDAERWTASFTDDTPGWRLVQIPFDTMTRKEVGNGAPNDGFGLTEIHGWAFGSLATPGAARFHLDEVQVYGVAPPKPLTVGFSRVDQSVVEGTTATVQLRLSKPSPDPVTARVRTTSGTAVPGRDFAELDTTVTFAANQTVASVAVPTYDDAKHQGSRGVVLDIASASGADRGMPLTTRVQITDDETLDPTLVEDFEATPYLWDGLSRGTRLVSMAIEPGSPTALPDQTATERVLSATTRRSETGAQRTFAAPQDWSAHDGISFWYYGYGTGKKVTVGATNSSPRNAAGAPTYTLAWADEFRSRAGAAPDPNRWSYDLGDGTIIGAPGWGNDELEFYTSSTSNAATDGRGNLVITTRAAPEDSGYTCYYGPCRYTSARLVTKDKAEFAYGRIEARIRVPQGSGLWPAFWSLGTNIDQIPWPTAGEIDIMENVGREPSTAFGTIHGPGYSGGQSFGGTYDVSGTLGERFHTFAVDWQPDHITWTIDGVAYHEATPADVAPNEWVFNHPFSLLLNTAVGGNFGGPVGADTTFPQRMLVDYVRVYQQRTRTTSFSSTFRDDQPGWRLVTLPFDDFASRSGATFDPSAVTGLSISTTGLRSRPILLDEIRLSCASTSSVTSTADDGAGSLRAALGTLCHGGTAEFDESLAGQTVTLSSPLTPANSVTIDGSAAPGVTVSGGGTSRVLEVAAGTEVTVRHTRLARGYGWELAGGAIVNGTLTLDHADIVDSTVATSGNDWWKGGAGVYVGEGGTLTASDCQISGNTVTSGPAGGIYAHFHSTVTLDRCAISGNSATDVGGGLRLLGNSVLRNTTITGNTATGWHGGGLFATDGTLDIESSTIAGNTAPDGAAGGLFVGTFGDSGVAASVTGTIIADNSGDECIVGRFGAGPVTLDSTGHNLFADGTCATAQSTDLVGVAAGLGPLGDNGGPTPTMALLDGSAALDAGDPATAPAIDQRGVTRPQGLAPDIGAFERD